MVMEYIGFSVRFFKRSIALLALVDRIKHS